MINKELLNQALQITQNRLNQIKSDTELTEYFEPIWKRYLRLRRCSEEEELNKWEVNPALFL